MTNIPIRDNCYVISSSKEHIEKLMKEAELVKPKGVINGLRHLTRTPKYQKLRLLMELEKLGCDTSLFRKEIMDEPSIPKESMIAFENENKKHKKKDKKQGKKQGKKKGKKFKDKKSVKRLNEHIDCNLTERGERSGNLMAELIKKADYMSIIDGCLWIYNQKTGCYDSCDVNNVSSKLRTLLSEHTRLKVSYQEYREAYNQLMISAELVSDKEFFENKPYINCRNGVVDVREGKLLSHSPSYRFKHYIRANYDPNAKCEKFLEFINIITAGDKELIDLIRVVIGLIFSHYNNFKRGFLLYGPSNVGKSVLCSVLEAIIGDDYVSNCDLSDLQKQEYVAKLSGMLLNIAPDIKNEELKDVGAFKSLTSHNDTIAARALYANPCKVRGETTMLFSSNHLLSFDSKLDIGDIVAVFNRLVYIPFMNQPFTETDDKKDHSLTILEERDGIFAWACGGLKMYLDNGERFPHSKQSVKLKQKNMTQFCPEKVFVDKCITLEKDSFESTEVVRKAYEAFCAGHDATVKGNIRAYIISHCKVNTKKKRIDEDGNLISSGSPKACYEGIRLKDKYRVN